jgi:DNA-binding IclR family transcriptional regulator
VVAFSPDLSVTEYLEGQLKAYTEFTLTRITDLQAEFETIRQRGYAECVEEIERGMASVAATLGETGPGATMSIGATGSTRVFTPKYRQFIGQTIIGLATSLSATLGWDAPVARTKTG